MTEAEFDKLIRYHEYQARHWGPETVAHKDHGEWALALHALKETISQLSAKVEDS